MDLETAEKRITVIETRLDSMQAKQDEMHSRINAIYYAVAVLIPTALANLIGTIV